MDNNLFNNTRLGNKLLYHTIAVLKTQMQFIAGQGHRLSAISFKL